MKRDDVLMLATLVSEVDANKAVVELVIPVGHLNLPDVGIDALLSVAQITVSQN